MNKTLAISHLKYDNRINLELPYSSQPWTRTILVSNPDPLELAPICKWSRDPKGEASALWNIRLYIRMISFGKYSPNIFMNNYQIPKPSLGLGLIENILGKGSCF